MALEASGGQAPFDWQQIYIDPRNYTNRVCDPGYHSNVTIAGGVSYPVGYRVSDGHTVGGVQASGTSEDAYPIRLPPPTSGSGALRVYQECKLSVWNKSTTNGSFFVYLGVDSPSEDDMPMYPYLGIGHDTGAQRGITVRAGETVQIAVPRIDVLDNAFQGGRPIPNWPNWTLIPSPGNLLFPAISPIFVNDGKVPLTVMDVLCVSYAVR